jgi:hypothetical protein
MLNKLFKLLVLTSILLYSVTFNPLPRVHADDPTLEELMTASNELAEETATYYTSGDYEGKLQAAHLLIPYDQERVFTFSGYDSTVCVDCEKVTITDNSNTYDSLDIVVDENNHIVVFTFPDQTTFASVVWDGNEVDDIIVKTSPFDPGVSMAGRPSCAAALQIARIALVTAGATCYGAGPRSLQCWSAVAAATYAVYNAYVACSPN